MSKNFRELNINEQVVELLRRSGIKEATPVQEAVIPLVRSGRDVLVQSQTGTGKTLAFLLPIMEKIKVNAPAVQALVVAPTRELALQIAGVASSVGEALGIRTMCIYGGQNLDQQVDKIGRQPHIVVGTPGRLLDHLRRKTLDITNVNKVVLDEADQMLHMGFIDDVETLLDKTAADRQTLFFSATIPDRIKALSRRYMMTPQYVHIAPETITLEEIEQIVVNIDEAGKMDKLCDIINSQQPYLAMVFCHTKGRVTQVCLELAKRGYLADELHGDLTQAQRKLVMQRFSSAKLQILVATDIAARGLDIEGVTHVVNYDIPHDAETYIHRIGRTGRAGQTGKAITFVTARQHDYLRLIEKGIKMTLDKQRQALKKSVKPPRDAADKRGEAAKPDGKYGAGGKKYRGGSPEARRKKKLRARKTTLRRVR